MLIAQVALLSDFFLRFYHLQIRIEARLASASVDVGRIAPDEERLVLSKPVMQLSFTYGLSKCNLYICLYSYAYDMVKNI